MYNRAWPCTLLPYGVAVVPAVVVSVVVSAAGAVVPVAISVVSAVAVSVATVSVAVVSAGTGSVVEVSVVVSAVETVASSVVLGSPGDPRIEICGDFSVVQRSTLGFIRYETLANRRIGYALYLKL